MADLSVRYLGLNLKNPILVASSGLTKSVAKLQACEDAGAGAVVLKSLFEEALYPDKIFAELFQPMGKMYQAFREEVSLQFSPQEYIELIVTAKQTLSIPVIASLNVRTENHWLDFLPQIEKAGADALEINIFPMLSDAAKSARDVEQSYFKIAKKARSAVGLPIAIKIAPVVSALPYFARRLAQSGIQGLVLFDRSVEPDFDIRSLTASTALHFSANDNIHLTLRWIAIMSDRVNINWSATGGIHTGEAVIKLLLAGATTVQLASALYKNGFHYIQYLLKEIHQWMKNQGFESIAEFRGLLNFPANENPDLFFRKQFMETIRRIE